MTEGKIASYLSGLEKKIIIENKGVKIELTRKWAQQFPINAGVYVIRQNKTIFYVGETGSLRARMNDLLETRNHVIRRNAGNDNFKGHPNFERATSKKTFHPDIEALLNNWMTTKLKVSVLEINLGRKELEELLFSKYKPKYNIKGKRKGRMTTGERFVDKIKDWELE